MKSGRRPTPATCEILVPGGKLREGRVGHEIALLQDQVGARRHGKMIGDGGQGISPEGVAVEEAGGQREIARTRPGADIDGRRPAAPGCRPCAKAEAADQLIERGAAVGSGAAVRTAQDADGRSQGRRGDRLRVASGGKAAGIVANETLPPLPATPPWAFRAKMPRSVTRPPLETSNKAPWDTAMSPVRSTTAGTFTPNPARVVQAFATHVALRESVFRLTVPPSVKAPPISVSGVASVSLTHKPLTSSSAALPTVRLNRFGRSGLVGL